jgi:hypothetical protein
MNPDDSRIMDNNAEGAEVDDDLISHKASTRKSKKVKKKVKVKKRKGGAPGEENE